MTDLAISLVLLGNKSKKFDFVHRIPENIMNVLLSTLLRVHMEQ